MLAHTLRARRDALDALKAARRAAIGEEVLTAATDMEIGERTANWVSNCELRRASRPEA